MGSAWVRLRPSQQENAGGRHIKRLEGDHGLARGAYFSALEGLCLERGRYEQENQDY